MKFNSFRPENVYKGVNFDTVVNVTDPSQYRPDAEQVRALKFSPQGSGVTPIYDYPDGEVPQDDTVTDELVALRQGKLDKAEVEALKDSIISSAKSENDKKLEEKRLEKLDSLLGVDKSDNSSDK